MFEFDNAVELVFGTVVMIILLVIAIKVLMEACVKPCWSTYQGIRHQGRDSPFNDVENHPPIFRRRQDVQLNPEEYDALVRTLRHSNMTSTPYPGRAQYLPTNPIRIKPRNGNNVIILLNLKTQFSNF